MFYGEKSCSAAASQARPTTAAVVLHVPAPKIACVEVRKAAASALLSMEVARARYQQGVANRALADFSKAAESHSLLVQRGAWEADW